MQRSMSRGLNGGGLQWSAGRPHGYREEPGALRSRSREAGRSPCAPRRSPRMGCPTIYVANDFGRTTCCAMPARTDALRLHLHACDASRRRAPACSARIVQRHGCGVRRLLGRGRSTSSSATSPICSARGEQFRVSQQRRRERAGARNRAVHQSRRSARARARRLGMGREGGRFDNSGRPAVLQATGSCAGGQSLARAARARHRQRRDALRCARLAAHRAGRRPQRGRIAASFFVRRARGERYVDIAPALGLHLRCRRARHRDRRHGARAACSISRSPTSGGVGLLPQHEPATRASSRCACASRSIRCVSRSSIRAVRCARAPRSAAPSERLLGGRYDARRRRREQRAFGPPRSDRARRSR